MNKKFKIIQDIVDLEGGCLDLEEGNIKDVKYLDKYGNDITIYNEDGTLNYRRGIDGKSALNSSIDLCNRNKLDKYIFGKNEYDFKLEELSKEFGETKREKDGLWIGYGNTDWWKKEYTDSDNEEWYDVMKRLKKYRKKLLKKNKKNDNI